MFARFHGNHSDAATSQQLWEIHLHPRSIFHSLKFLSSEINTWRHKHYQQESLPRHLETRTTERQKFIREFSLLNCISTNQMWHNLHLWANEAMKHRECLLRSVPGGGRDREMKNSLVSCLPHHTRPDCGIHDMGTDWSGRGANSIIPPLQS